MHRNYEFQKGVTSFYDVTKLKAILFFAIAIFSHQTLYENKLAVVLLYILNYLI